MPSYYKRSRESAFQSTQPFLLGVSSLHFIPPSNLFFIAILKIEFKNDPNSMYYKAIVSFVLQFHASPTQMLKWTSSYSAANVYVRVAQARAVSAFQKQFECSTCQCLQDCCSASQLTCKCQDPCPCNQTEGCQESSCCQCSKCESGTCECKISCSCSQAEGCKRDFSCECKVICKCTSGTCECKFSGL